MQFLPEVIAANYINHYCIHLRFNDGTEKSVDFSCWLKGAVFQPLKDVTYFKRFFLDGGTVCWPNGADIAPEALFAAEPVGMASRKHARREAVQS